VERVDPNLPIAMIPKCKNSIAPSPMMWVAQPLIDATTSSDTKVQKYRAKKQSFTNKLSFVKVTRRRVRRKKGGGKNLLLAWTDATNNWMDSRIRSSPLECRMPHMGRAGCCMIDLLWRAKAIDRLRRIDHRLDAVDIPTSALIQARLDTPGQMPGL
jgi:hypothetical protein